MRCKPAICWGIYIDLVPNRGSKPAVLQRESIREGKRIRKRTVANLSALTLEQAEAIRREIKGEGLAPACDLECVRSWAFGHVELLRSTGSIFVRSRLRITPDEKNQLFLSAPGVGRAP